MDQKKFLTRDLKWKEFGLKKYGSYLGLSIREGDQLGHGFIFKGQLWVRYRVVSCGGAAEQFSYLKELFRWCSQIKWIN